MAPPCVLLADNDASVNSLLHGLLVGQGLRCESVHDGEAALERLRHPGIDVLVTDLDMPKVSGLELLAEIAGFPAIPRVVVISGYIDAEVRAQLEDTPSVCRILTKPFDVMEFAATVAALAHPALGEAHG